MIGWIENSGQTNDRSTDSMELRHGQEQETDWQGNGFSASEVTPESVRLKWIWRLSWTAGKSKKFALYLLNRMNWSPLEAVTLPVHDVKTRPQAQRTTGTKTPCTQILKHLPSLQACWDLIDIIWLVRHVKKNLESSIETRWEALRNLYQGKLEAAWANHLTAEAPFTIFAQTCKLRCNSSLCEERMHHGIYVVL